MLFHSQQHIRIAASKLLYKLIALADYYFYPWPFLSLTLVLLAPAPGFSCSKYFVYGVFSARLKLPPNYSGGVIPCMYLTSAGTSDFHTNHDEIDFEFLGNTSAQEITIHTNLISQGWNKLEQVSCWLKEGLS